MLNVIDENLLDLTETEAAEICKMLDLPTTKCNAALRRSYGRVATFLKQLKEGIA
jgi:uncharacterized protein (DUF1778 family)